MALTSFVADNTGAWNTEVAERRGRRIGMRNRSAGIKGSKHGS